MNAGSKKELVTLVIPPNGNGEIPSVEIKDIRFKNGTVFGLSIEAFEALRSRDDEDEDNAKISLFVSHDSEVDGIELDSISIELDGMFGMGGFASVHVDISELHAWFESYNEAISYHMAERSELVLELRDNGTLDFDINNTFVEVYVKVGNQSFSVRVSPLAFGHYIEAVSDILGEWHDFDYPQVIGDRVLHLISQAKRGVEIAQAMKAENCSREDILNALLNERYVAGSPANSQNPLRLHVSDIPLAGRPVLDATDNFASLPYLDWQTGEIVG
jgi:hypothetical protein